MLIKFSELPIPFGRLALGAVMLDDLMSKTVEEDWMVLV